MANRDERIILLTGATAGLGQTVATDLARQGATLLLHGRNPEKGQRVLDDIRSATGNDRLFYYNADFSSLEEVRRLAEEVAANQPRLDVLINNAGLGAGPDPDRRQTGAEGYELRLTVNYLAPFVLTRRLLPLLQTGAEAQGEARIVNVASAGQQALDFDDVMLEHGYSGMRAYRQSKLALVMFTFDLAAELVDSQVTANALHPASLMDTRMVREWFGQSRTTVEEGARYVERLAVDPELKGVSGEYFDQGKKARAEDQAYDGRARQRLRELTERWLGA